MHEHDCSRGGLPQVAGHSGAGQGDARVAVDGEAGEADAELARDVHRDIVVEGGARAEPVRLHVEELPQEPAVALDLLNQLRGAFGAGDAVGGATVDRQWLVQGAVVFDLEQRILREVQRPLRVLLDPALVPEQGRRHRLLLEEGEQGVVDKRAVRPAAGVEGQGDRRRARVERLHDPRQVVTPRPGLGAVVLRRDVRGPRLIRVHPRRPGLLPQGRAGAGAGGDHSPVLPARGVPQGQTRLHQPAAHGHVVVGILRGAHGVRTI
ncbi:hypothetical protein CHUV2995_03130 [Corynebacterium diphtheriae subsp. lausannense]|nr:hypothetical protein CHUV2995_03130 [Corynebacterium diphtheriae subsp. lausannense]